MTELKFHYESPGDGRQITVAVNADCYDKRLTFAQHLAHKLRAAIPFPFEMSHEPEIHLLGGDCVRGMMSVEMRIVPRIPYIIRAMPMLEARGFTRGLEPRLDP